MTVNQYEKLDFSFNEKENIFSFVNILSVSLRI